MILAEAGLVSYWRLGEGGADTVAVDEKGVNPGTYTGTTGLKVGGALVDDTNSAATMAASDATVKSTVSVPDSSTLDLGNGPFTLEAWVKRNVSAAGTILGKGSQTYLLKFNVDVIDFRQSGVGRICVSTTSIVDLGVWHHVVVTRGAAGATNNIYIDGADVTGSITSRTLTDNSSALGIGTDSGVIPLRGDLDEVAIYNVVLTPTQVLNHYQLGLGLPDTVAAIPTINSGPSVTKISQVAGKNVATFTFVADEDYDAYELRVVPSDTSPHTAGTLIESGGPGYLGATRDLDVTDDELVAASGGEGANVVKVFLQDLSGNWSA
jgi:hypothetical protein